MLGRLDALVPAAIFACTTAAIMADPPLPLSDLDIFFMEVALATALGYIVFRYSQKSDRGLQSHLGEVKLMLQRSERARQIRKAHANKSLHAILDTILSSCRTLSKLGATHADASASESQRLKSDFSRLRHDIGASVERLGRELEHADYLDDRTYDDIAVVVNTLDTPVRTSGNEDTLDIEHYRAAIDLLPPLLLRLERRLDLGTGAFSLPPPESASPPGRLEVRLDRDTYPPGAAIRATVTADGSFPSKKVTISILDDRLEVMATKTKKAPPPDAPDACTLAEEIRAVGTAAGGEYTVRAVCGGLVAEAVFVVEHIPPVIETDKSLYLMDADMLITVIDPAASTGGKKEGYVGDRKNSRLVIESPHGRLDGYRLKETEPSSGTYQGVVACMGVRADGSPRGVVLDGKRVGKTRGKGSEDGVIACGPGQLIQIRYESASGTDSTEVLVGGFETAIEVDRDEYTCLSNVKICLISSDFGVGESDQPAAIGDDRRECWLSISTSEGMLDGYRLVESKPESGDFRGTISLTGLATMKNKKNSSGLVCGKTGGAGPADGTLACRPDDTLKVSFTTGFAKPVHCEAPVHWHIGKIRFSKASYLPGEEITVRVEDLDMSLGRDRPDRLSVRAWSDSDRRGIQVPAVETGLDSGVFEGRFRTGGGPSIPSQTLLNAGNGDTVSAEYVDETLPSPYGGDNSIVVSTSAVVTTSRKLQSPLERLVVDDILVQGKQPGDGMLTIGEKAQVTIRVKNPGREISFAVLLQIADQNGVTAALLHQQLTARLNGYVAHTFSWIPIWQGTHNITVFLWKGADHPVAYSHPAYRQVQVVDSPAAAARSGDGQGNLAPGVAIGDGGGLGAA